MPNNNRLQQIERHNTPGENIGAELLFALCNLTDTDLELMPALAQLPHLGTTPATLDFLSWFRLLLSAEAKRRETGAAPMLPSFPALVESPANELAEVNCAAVQLLRMASSEFASDLLTPILALTASSVFNAVKARDLAMAG